MAVFEEGEADMNEDLLVAIILIIGFATLMWQSYLIGKACPRLYVFPIVPIIKKKSKEGLI